MAKSAEEELRKHDLDTKNDPFRSEDDLMSGITNRTDVFLVNQTQSESKWGLLNKNMEVVGRKGLDVIDHRAWSHRGINTYLVNEVYARSYLKVGADQTIQEALDALIEDITTTIKDINQSR